MWAARLRIAFWLQTYLAPGSKRSTEVVSHLARAHALDTESMMIATAAATAKAAEAFELGAVVLLTASAPSLGDQRTVTTAAIVADAVIVINAISIMIAIVTTAVDVVTEAETVDDQIADTRSTRSMNTSPSLILRVMVRLLLSGGRRLRRGGTTDGWLCGAASRRDECTRP